MKFVKRNLPTFILVLVMIAGSKIASNYFIVAHTNINPLSKDASLLTLLFMCFFAFGVLTGLIIMKLEKNSRNNRNDIK